MDLRLRISGLRRGGELIPGSESHVMARVSPAGRISGPAGPTSRGSDKLPCPLVLPFVSLEPGKISGAEEHILAPIFRELPRTVPAKAGRRAGISAGNLINSLGATV